MKNIALRFLMVLLLVDTADAAWLLWKHNFVTRRVEGHSPRSERGRGRQQMGTAQCRRHSKRMSGSTASRAEKSLRWTGVDLSERTGITVDSSGWHQRIGVHRCREGGRVIG